MFVLAGLLAAGCGAGAAPPTPTGAFNVQVILGPNQGVWSGYPAGGVKLILEAGASVQVQTTDANGRATFPTAPTGPYEISAIPPTTLPAAAMKLRDLHVGTTGTDIVVVLPHRVPTGTTPPRTPDGPGAATLTGTVRDKDGNLQPSTGDTGPAVHSPGNVGIVTYTGTGAFSTLTDASGVYTISRPLSNDRPASTGSLFAGNWDRLEFSERQCFGGSRLSFTQYAYVPAVDAYKGQTTTLDLNMAAVTGSVTATVDADGQAFLASLDGAGACGFSLADLFLYHAIHSSDLWLSELFHDSGVASVTSPVPQIPLDQGVYWYGVGVAGRFDGSELVVYGQTLTFLVAGATSLRVSYLQRPGNPTVGGGAEPEVSWTASAGATLYEVDVFDGSGNLVFVGATATNLSVKLPMPLPPGTYSVQVLANDSLRPSDYLAGRMAGGRPRLRPVGSVLGPKHLRVRADRRRISRQLAPVSRTFRLGGPLFRPFLDRTPFTNNDDRWSWSDVVPFAR